ncbi:hypothetical protein MCUN1_003134 [Malassezia cuniculi]|uniref:Uncharacterized protein n=1 Tax=Malassezia cuniculi TaxID=948313 RepID=A0AAF0JCU1_9BASI|nr:hypothetical protein MCUN1_003134 [Malassezia cuniculi]
MSDADKREARRQRILARGGDRLSKIVNTGRGEDYVGLDTTPVLRKETAAPDPPDEPIPEIGSSSALAASGFPAASGAPGSDAPGSDAPGSAQQDPLAALLNSFQGQAKAQGADTTDPTALLRSILQGASGPAPAQAVDTVAVARTQRLDRRLRLVQATFVFAFAFFIVFSSILAPVQEVGITGRALEHTAGELFARHSFLSQWASLARTHTPIAAWLSHHDPSLFPWGALRTPLDLVRPYVKAPEVSTLPSWPIFWVFVSLEVALQGVRISLMQQLPTPPPSALSRAVTSFAPGLLPYLTPVLSFVAFANSMIDDLCILLFAIGVGIFFSHVRLLGADVPLSSTSTASSSLL